MQMRDYVTKYDSLASEDSLLNIPYRKQYVLSQIGRGKRVLDVGCLGGKFSKLIQDQNNEVWGVELNPVAAATAERLGIRVKVANVEDGLPFEDGMFDVVNAGEVVEHLYDTKYFFEEARRVLMPNGIFIFSTPNLNSLENRVRVMMGGYLSMTGAYPEDHFGEHIRFFNLAKVKELADQTGFELKNVKGISHLGSYGKLIDFPLFMAGRFFPHFSKMLLITAQKKSQ